MPFVLKVGGEEYNTDDLTLDEAISIEKATGESWFYINPLRSAAHNREITRIFLARTRSAEEVESLLAKRTMVEALNDTSVVETDLPDEYEDGIPKAEGAPSTPTS